jgi:tRNA(fMet)-specific endonuclease VapC
MTPYLLDTNIASYIIKGSSPIVRRRLNQVAMAQVSISVVTEGELRYGVARRPEATRLHNVVEQFFLRVKIHPWDSEAARQYGAIRAAVERSGQPIGNLDIMIAAHATALGAVLVTNDHTFRRIDALRIEDWTKASSG